jgi:hypothetical protein
VGKSYFKDNSYASHGIKTKERKENSYFPELWFVRTIIVALLLFVCLFICFAVLGIKPKPHTT